MNVMRAAMLTLVCSLAACAELPGTSIPPQSSLPASPSVVGGVAPSIDQAAGHRLHEQLLAGGIIGVSHDIGLCYAGASNPEQLRFCLVYDMGAKYTDDMHRRVTGRNSPYFERTVFDRRVDHFGTPVFGLQGVEGLFRDHARAVASSR